MVGIAELVGFAGAGAEEGFGVVLVVVEGVEGTVVFNSTFKEARGCVGVGIAEVVVGGSMGLVGEWCAISLSFFSCGWCSSGSVVSSLKMERVRRGS